MITAPALAAAFSASADRLEWLTVAGMRAVHLREPVLNGVIFFSFVMLELASLGFGWAAMRSLFFGFSWRLFCWRLRRICFLQLSAGALLLLRIFLAI